MLEDKALWVWGNHVVVDQILVASLYWFLANGALEEVEEVLPLEPLLLVLLGGLYLVEKVEKVEVEVLLLEPLRLVLLVLDLLMVEEVAVLPLEPPGPIREVVLLLMVLVVILEGVLVLTSLEVLTKGLFMILVGEALEGVLV
tara:strand:- start:318 stop:746 length:429 start_codon:yes stop_codon:yes gene_type:complete